MNTVKYNIRMFFVAVVIISNFNQVYAADMNKNEMLGDIKAQLAMEFYRSGDIRTAIKTVEDAVSANSRSVAAWLARAEIYQYMKDASQVERSFQRALAIKEYVGETNNNYGWYLCENGQVAKSIAHFDRAVADRIYTSPFVALTNKGICLSRLKQYEKANDALMQALRLAPSGYYFTKKELARNSLAMRDTPSAERYFSEYTSRLDVLSADDLLLGVKIGRLSGRHEWVSQNITQLRNEYPLSPEFQEAMTGNK